MIVFDRIQPGQDDGPNEFTLWWHFGKHGNAVLKDDGCQVDCLLPGRRLNVQCISNAGAFKARIYKGEKKARIQGWESSKYMVKSSAPVLGLSTQATGVFHSITLFNLSSTETEQPSCNILAFDELFNVTELALVRLMV